MKASVIIQEFLKIFVWVEKSPVFRSVICYYDVEITCTANGSLRDGTEDPGN
jgi:hypothetical protein